MKKWEEVFKLQHDATSVDVPSAWLWEQTNGIYYPTKKIDFVKMSEDDFYEKYSPVKNHLDDNASFDGCMFETYGKELDFVKDHNTTCPQGIWTVVETDGELYFVSGYHFVNRFGYLITFELVPMDVEIEVKLDNEIDE